MLLLSLRRAERHGFEYSALEAVRLEPGALPHAQHRRQTHADVGGQTECGLVRKRRGGRSGVLRQMHNARFEHGRESVVPPAGTRRIR